MTDFKKMMGAENWAPLTLDELPEKGTLSLSRDTSIEADVWEQIELRKIVIHPFGYRIFIDPKALRLSGDD